ncbi:MAG TPA: cysteine desulfurase [Terriglobales bacterium]|jgi:cysteine desulfurase/selenocysteine lyase|nr:cysteine desulfurase [Terriglobales bacterium]
MTTAANVFRWPEPATQTGFDVHKVRAEFPILARRVKGKPLVYLDNAATTQKPQPVIDALVRYYTAENANIHRGVHTLSELATESYEQARAVVQRFLHAADPSEIVFVRGATEGINLVAQTWGRTHVGSGDEIVISAMEHHSNIVPWQILCEQQGARLRVAPINDDGELLLDELEKLLGPKTKLVAMVHVSNALGTVNPARKVVEMGHRWNARVLLDGAQAVPHTSVDVRGLDCDFYVFSAHKVYGPTGIGVLYGKAELLDAMPPYQGGGDMISSVTFEKTLYNRLPYKFEAGTPHVAGGIGLGAALEYVNAIGIDRIAKHEHQVLACGTERLQAIPELRLIGTAREKAGVLSFVMEGIHPHDVGTILDQEGIAIRTGHHCAQPLMQRFGVPATARASLALYNTMEDIDALAGGLQKVREVFA